jgi:O-antigen/teichoic acid export membrane protein
MKWTSISAVVVTVCQLGQLSILARYLDDSDFGLMAIVLVVVGFASTFADMGVSNAIIQRQSITHRQLSSLYWLNLFSGLLLSIAVVCLAPFIVRFYQRPELFDLLLLLSVSFFIVSIGNQYRVLCQKELQFNRMALIEISSAFIAFVVAVSMAVSGYGVYSLVWGSLSKSITTSAAYTFVGIRHHHRPSFVYDHESLAEIYGFGLFQIGERSINYFSANMDKILLGKMVGMDAVGQYDLAYRLIIFPLTKINPIVNRIAFPVFSKYQNEPESLGNCYGLGVKALSLVTIPLLVFLFIFSEDVVLVMFDEGWDSVSDLVKILSVVGIIKAIGNPGGSLILALGRADVGFWWNVVWATCLGLAIFLTLRFFPNVYAAAICVLALSIVLGSVWHLLIHRIGKVSYRPLIVHVTKVLLVTAVVCLASAFAVGFISDSATPFIKVVLGIVFCIVLYSPFFVVQGRQFLRQYRRMQD